MQTLVRAERERRRSVLTGIALVIACVIVLATAGIVYVRPFGQQYIHFATTDAASITTGMEVRVAGVSVGKVTGISLAEHEVDVTARLSNSVFVGDRSTVDVRMLTPVGGFAVTVIPVGGSELGDAVIPSSRVTVPYTISDILQSTPKVTDEVSGSVIHANIDQVAVALGDNVGSVGSVLKGMDAVAQVMDAQRNQVRRITQLGAEYTRTFNSSRDMVFSLLRQVDMVTATYENSSAGFNEAYKLLGDVLMRVVPFMKFYGNHKDQVRVLYEKLRESVLEVKNSFDPALNNLLALQKRLRDWITPAGMRTLGDGTISAEDYCVPLRGKKC